ncbi:MAG: hypothetical protein ACREF3_20290, partial [Acetobacteraceae bacterium]
MQRHRSGHRSLLIGRVCPDYRRDARVAIQRSDAMDWIEVNDVSVRYDLTGTGPTTLVLVHE